MDNDGTTTNGRGGVQYLLAAFQLPPPSAMCRRLESDSTTTDLTLRRSMYEGRLLKISIAVREVSFQFGTEVRGHITRPAPTVRGPSSDQRRVTRVSLETSADSTGAPLQTSADSKGPQRRQYWSPIFRPAPHSSEQTIIIYHRLCGRRISSKRSSLSLLRLSHHYLQPSARDLRRP